MHAAGEPFSIARAETPGKCAYQHRLNRFDRVCDPAVLLVGLGVCLVLTGNAISHSHYANQAQRHSNTGKRIRLFAEPDFRDILRERDRGMCSPLHVDGVLFYLWSNGMTMEVMTVAIGTRWPKMQDVALQEFRSG